MKKLLVIAAILIPMVAANAQQFGVKGGYTLSTMSGAANPKENKAEPAYEAGILYKADLGSGFVLQPALSFQTKAATLKQNNDVRSKTGYAEFSIGAQWGPDLDIIRPFIFVEPFVGYGVTGKETLSLSGSATPFEKYSAALADAKNKLEYGVGAGLGLEVARHIQVSCQVFQNLGKLYKEDHLDTGDLVDIKASYKDLKSYQGVKLTVAILF